MDREWPHYALACAAAKSAIVNQSIFHGSSGIKIIGGSINVVGRGRALVHHACIYIGWSFFEYC